MKKLVFLIVMILLFACEKDPVYKPYCETCYMGETRRQTVVFWDINGNDSIVIHSRTYPVTEVILCDEEFEEKAGKMFVTYGHEGTLRIEIFYTCKTRPYEQ